MKHFLVKDSDLRSSYSAERKLVICKILRRILDMGRGKGTNARKGRHERLPPAESAEDISTSLNSLSLDSNIKSSFPVPLAMWVCYPA